MVRDTFKRKGKYVIWEWECDKCGYETYATIHQMKSFKIYRCPNCEPINKKSQKRIKKIGTMSIKENLGNTKKGDSNIYLWECECGQYEVQATTFQIRQQMHLCPYCINFKKYSTLTARKAVRKKYDNKQPVYLWECECGKYQVEATVKEIKIEANLCPCCVPKEQKKKGTMIQIKESEKKNRRKNGRKTYIWECECGRYQVELDSKEVEKKENQCPFCMEEQLIQKEETVNHFKIVGKTDKRAGSYVVYVWECEFCKYRVEATKTQIKFKKYSKHKCKRSS